MMLLLRSGLFQIQLPIVRTTVADFATFTTVTARSIRTTPILMLLIILVIIAAKKYFGIRN